VIASASSRGGKGLLAVHNKPPNLSHIFIVQEVTYTCMSNAAIDHDSIPTSTPLLALLLGQQHSAPGQLYSAFAPWVHTTQVTL
jgi:hypothetical protein